MAIKRINTYKSNKIVPEDADDFISGMIKKKMEKLKTQALEPFIKEDGLADKYLTYRCEGENRTFDWRNWHNDAGVLTDINGEKHEDSAFYFGNIIIDNNEENRNSAMMMAVLSVEAVGVIMDAAPKSELEAAIKKNKEESDISDYNKLLKIAKERAAEYIQANYPHCYEWKGDFVIARAIEAYFYYTVDSVTGSLVLGLQRYITRLSKTDWFKDKTIPEQIVYASMFLDVAYKIHKIGMCRKIEAPEIILANEFRQLFEMYMVIMSKNIHFMSEQDYIDEFGYNFAGEWIGCKEKTDIDMPPFPEDLPKYDAEGNPIPYFYNEETKKWEKAFDTEEE